jgi:hypothetical protein
LGREFPLQNKILRPAKLGPIDKDVLKIWAEQILQALLFGVTDFLIIYKMLL